MIKTWEKKKLFEECVLTNSNYFFMLPQLKFELITLMVMTVMIIIDRNTLVLCNFLANNQHLILIIPYTLYGNIGLITTLCVPLNLHLFGKNLIKKFD